MLSLSDCKNGRSGAFVKPEIVANVERVTYWPWRDLLWAMVFVWAPR